MAVWTCPAPRKKEEEEEMVRAGSFVLVGCDGEPEEMNKAPRVTAPIPDQEIMEEDRGEVDLTHHFKDDYGDSLTYVATASNAVVCPCLRQASSWCSWGLEGERRM